MVNKQKAKVALAISAIIVLAFYAAVVVIFLVFGKQDEEYETEHTFVDRIQVDVTKDAQFYVDNFMSKIDEGYGLVLDHYEVFNYVNGTMSIDVYFTNPMFTGHIYYDRDTGEYVGKLQGTGVEPTRSKDET